jgi:DNA-binding PadR family transcriptional regulator
MSRATASNEHLGASPLQGVLLAILLGEQEQPLHGYMLTTLVERRLGPAWGVTRQSVYAALERLENEGLVSSGLKTAAVRSGPGRRQRVYSPTETAEGAFAAWMESPISREPMRVELQAKIAVSRARDAPLLLRALDGYERDCFELLSETKEAVVPMGSWAGLALNLTRTAVDESLQAELLWIGKARRWIKEFMAEMGDERAG